jgi:hypothetical protein
LIQLMIDWRKRIMWDDLQDHRRRQGELFA